MSKVCLSSDQAPMGDKYGDGKDDYDGQHSKNSKGYLSQLAGEMRVFWATKHTENTEHDRQLFIKTTVRELVIYSLFLTVLIIISFGTSNDLKYYYSNFINNLFTGSYTTARSVEDYWKFLSGPLMSGLYWNQWYNSQPIAKSEINYIFYENKLLGVPRLRQVRVGNASCAIVADYQNDIKLCYAAYSTSVESTDSFGLANSTAWNYTSEKALNGRSSDGFLATYSGGGYYVDLNLTQSDSINTINFLFSNYWIDRGTRAVIIDFTVYNANTNLFCVVKLVAEFPATGGVIPNAEFRTVKLIRYVIPIDYVVLTCEIIFIIFVMYYIVEEGIEIEKHKLSYFASIWNILDIIVILLGILMTSFNIYRSITIHNLLQKLLAQTSTYPNFDYISYLQLQFDYILALTLFVAWIKIFKYISFNETMNQLNKTLSRSAYDLGGFAMMFLVIFMAFAQMAYLMFGPQTNTFSSFIMSIYSLLRIILGEFDFTQLDNSNRVLGVIFFVIYIFFVFLVLFNVFMTIVLDAYNVVKQELENHSDEFQVTDYIKQRATLMLAKLNFKVDRINDIQSALNFADTDNDNRIDFEEWKIELKKRGYADAEIEAVFVRYDIDGDRQLDESERRQMQTELESQKAALNNEILNKEDNGNMGMNDTDMVESAVSIEDHLSLVSHVTRIEDNINAMVTKVDSVLRQLGKIEKAKFRRRETLAQILETLRSGHSMSGKDQRIKLEALVTEEIRKMNKESIKKKETNRSGLEF